MVLPNFSRWPARAWVTASVLALVACGGGGSSSSSTTPTAPPVLTLSGTATVSGVAAHGAPLLGAALRVIDANGAPVALLDAAGTRVTSQRSSTADGSFRLQLVASNTPLPLMLQAAGVDGAGTPVVLHSAVISNALPLVSNITPVSEALVALAVGTTPRLVFATRALASSTLPLLSDSTALASASDLVKSMLAANMTDAKVSNAKTLDLLGDASFLANRTTLDAVLDGSRIQVVKDNSAHDQLQLSNKFLAPGTVEVTVDLATARAELVLGSTGSVAKAITSTLKATTSPHKASLVNLATIDALTSSINAQIAQGASASTMTTALLGAYTQQDGRNKAAMGSLLAGMGGSNLQLGRWQLLGCVIDPIPTSGCTKFQVSALVINPAGQAVDTLSETLATDSSKPPKWLLIGNGHSSEVRIQQVAQLGLNLDGTATAGGPPASNGLQLRVRALDGTSTPVQTVTGATVQVPSGYGVRMVYCTARLLCVSAGSSPVAATGDLSDTLLQKTPGWIGSQDAALGAKYVATVTPVLGSAETFNSYLQARLATDLSTALFPKPDDALSLASVNGNLLLSWKLWADANPDMQVTSVRLITNSPLVVRDFALSGPMATSVFMPAPLATVTSFQIWIGAQDSLGRYFYSQFRSNL